MAGVVRSVAALQLALALLVVAVLAARGVAQEQERAGRDVSPSGRKATRHVVQAKLGPPMAAVVLLLTSALPVAAAVFLYAGLDLSRLALTEAVTIVTTFMLGSLTTALGAVLHRPRIVSVAAVASGAALYVVVGSLGGRILVDRPSDAPPLAASAGQRPAPATPIRARAGVTVKATPRWGFSTPGALTPYLVTVRNDSPSDLAGEVALVPATDMSPPPGAGASLNDKDSPSLNGSSSRQEPPEPAKPEVLSLGQTEFTVVPSSWAKLAPGDHLTYRAPVTLAGGGAEKSLTPLVVEAPHGYRAEFRDGSGRVIAISSPSATPTPPAAPRYAVALLSEVPRAAATLGWLTNFFGPRSGTVTTLSSARDVPDGALMLSGLQAVVIDGFETAELSPSQVRALRDFVALGGSLVLGGGSSGRRTASFLPDELVPLRPSGTAAASFAVLADLVGRTTTATATVVTGDLRSGRSVLTTADGVPLVVQADYGAGRVVQLAYDPLAEPLSSDEVLRDLAWEQGIARALARIGPGASDLVPPEQLWARTLRRPPWPAWPRWGLGLLVSYAVLVGALGFRARGARGWTGRARLAVPLAAVVFTVAVCVASTSRHGAVLPVVKVSTSTPDGTVLTTSYGGFQSVGGGRRRVALAPGAVTSTVFIAPSPLAPNAPAVSPRGSRGGVATSGNGDAHLDLETEPGGVRNVQLSLLDRRPGLDAHLRLTGTGPPERGGLRVTGSVTNLSSEPLRRLRAQLPEGALARITDVIRPGETIAVDAPFVWPGRITAGSGLRATQDDLVMFAAASRAFTRSGQVVVSGLNPPDGGPEAIVVQVQVVPLEAMENLLAATGGSHQVSSVTVPSGAVTRVLDLGGVPGIGPVDLTFNAYQPGPEVFDWIRGSWRAVPVPDGFERVVPLAASEVSDGLVRLRWADLGETRGSAGYGLALRR